MMVKALFAAILTMPFAAWSSCPTIDHFFEHIGDEPSNILTYIEVSPKAHAQCGRVQEPFGLGRYCSWQYPLRSEESEAHFKDLVTFLKTCFDDEGVEDFGVNHPDSHTSQQFTHAHDALTISIKDKSARKSTFVFVRVTPLGH